jgi:radical SAM protein with 4Fe4S-binding SPASM domain
MYHCGAGVATFNIDPYGNLQPCLMISHISYNITDGGFLKAWQNISGKLHKKAQGDVSQCNHCEKIQMCGFCPAFFALENGAEYIHSEYLCAMGSERLKQIKNSFTQGVYYDA